MYNKLMIGINFIYLLFCMLMFFDLMVNSVEYTVIYAQNLSYIMSKTELWVIKFRR